MKQLGELLDLSGKVAIVTGGSKGIGQGIVYRLAEAGASVLIANRDEAAMDDVVKELSNKGWTTAAVKADVSNEEDVKRMVATCEEKFGGVDILVNNAGIFPMVPLMQMTLDQFEKVIDVNLCGVFLCTKYAVEAMKKRGGGKIINISSVNALRATMPGLAHYSASKHGVWGFTKNSALELAEHNIQVNAIAPGGITTPGTAEGTKDMTPEQQEAANKAFLEQVPMHRWGQPDDIAKVALFLASDMAGYMTGEQIVVDGGMILGG